MPDSKPSMPAQVRHVKDALVTEFYGRIDLSDLSPTRQNADDSAFLTRALSALSTRMLTNCTSDEAAICVIDGRDDYGIDAVGTSDTAPVIWLIQAKWSNKGEAGFDTAAANKLVRGFKKLDEQDFDRFNSKFQTLAPKVKSILSDPNCMVKLVVAIMGENELHTDVEEVLIDAANDFNVFGRSVSHQILKGTDFHAQVRADIAPQPISITATMDSGWHYRDTPYEAYYGLVSMDEVANWHQTFGDKLFAKNVRKSLGLTTVNKRIVDTLNESPENFWYFNNGITIICQEVNKEFFKKRAAGEPVKIHMRDASIVNGAQTVASTDLATKNTETTLTDAYATVRVTAFRRLKKISRRRSLKPQTRRTIWNKEILSPLTRLRKGLGRNSSSRCRSHIPSNGAKWTLHQNSDAPLFTRPSPSRARIPIQSGQ
ncbi:hypothetical protein AYK61_21890 [Rhodococcus sp. SBT000017]|nr:hypothetical protein AYK61_21890 [Rhodococcus sp. SBT000017]